MKDIPRKDFLALIKWLQDRYDVKSLLNDNYSRGYAHAIDDVLDYIDDMDGAK